MSDENTGIPEVAEESVEATPEVVEPVADDGSAVAEEAVPEVAAAE